MDSENLIRMANRIGAFFEAMPDREEALEGIVTHIMKFWEPRMRAQFLAALDQGATDVDEVVRLAVAKHRTLLG